jgi:hypothetical protein
MINIGAIKEAARLADLSLVRVPFGWNHPNDKNTRCFNEWEHVFHKTSDLSDVSNVGKVDPLFRDMLEGALAFASRAFGLVTAHSGFN